MLIHDGRILLVKHVYQKYWYFPGGGVKWGETYEETARREMKEEAGAEGKTLQFCGVYNSYGENKSDSIALFLCTDFSYTGQSDREIEEVRMFNLSELPSPLEPGCARRLEEFCLGRISPSGRW
ncbi:MAG: NUDIX domain-containing protein [Spirochaetales bacterium]|nr:NUDIX domain-containing protein [Spirochaetales bacterium]